MYKISASTLFIGQSYLYLPTCHSTNDIATARALQNRVTEGFTVATSHQTAGRGQRGNTWESLPDKNLTLSTVLKPDFLNASSQFQLNIAVSLGIIDCLSEVTGAGLAIKWPNDIYFRNKKLGGILTENILKHERIEYTIIGIGINVNQVDFSIPTATSLSIITSKQYELAPILESLLECIEKRYLQLKAARFYPLKQQYLQLLYWFQETHRFERRIPPDYGLQFDGEIIGVDPAGKLAIATKEKEIQYFSFKEVHFVE